MSRTPIAAVAGVLGLAIYIAVAVVLGDQVAHVHWAVQAAYFLIAGSLWVMPMRWLILWAAHRR